MKESKFKIGDKFRYKEPFGQAPLDEDEVYEILEIDNSGNGYILKRDNTRGVNGQNYGDYTWVVTYDNVNIIDEIKQDFSIPYDEPEENEMDENCVAECRPGDHKCDSRKDVVIKLVQIGRNKMNEEFTVCRNGKTETELAGIALKRCKEYLLTNEINVEPDEQKGSGFWKLRAVMGYHLGDVEIIL